MGADARRRVVPKLVEIGDDGEPIAGEIPAEGDYVLADSDEEYIVDEPEEASSTPAQTQGREEATQLSERTEYIFQILFWTLPFTFLFALLDVLVQLQYAQQPQLQGELVRVTKRVPRTYIY